jgi:predicted PurR-regulated permease PerM
MMNDTDPHSGPVDTRRLLHWLIIAALALAVCGLIWIVTELFDRVHNTMIIIVFAVLFSYFVYPPIHWLAQRRVPVPIGTLIVYAGLAIVILGALAWLSPAVAAQAEDLTKSFPSLVASVQRQISDPAASPLLHRLPAPVRMQIAVNAGKAGALIGGLAAKIGTNALGIVSGTTTVIIDTSLIVGLTALILGDLTDIQHFGVRVVPKRYRASVVSFMREVDNVVGGFVRGQVLIAVSVGVAGTIGLLVAGVPYAVLLGLVSGILSIVPMVGPFIAAIVVLLITFFTVGLFKLIVIAVLYAVILALQQNVLTPVVVSKSVGVTPLVVFLAVLLGSEAYGILGALLSIPIAGILRVAAQRLFPSDAQSDTLAATLK